MEKYSRTKQLTSRQKQSINTKLRITGVSLDLFKRKGFDNVTINDICKTADISVGAFYHHFESKHEIINKSYEQVDLLIKEQYDQKDLSFEVNKLLYILSDQSHVIQDLGWIFVSDVYKNLIHMDEPYSLHPGRWVVVEVESCIRNAIKANEIVKDVSPKELTETLIRISRGVMFDWCLHKGNYDLTEKITHDLLLILNNYKINKLVFS